MLKLGQDSMYHHLTFSKKKEKVVSKVTKLKTGMSTIMQFLEINPESHARKLKNMWQANSG